MIRKLTLVAGLSLVLSAACLGLAAVIGGDPTDEAARAWAHRLNLSSEPRSIERVRPATPR